MGAASGPEAVFGEREERARFQNAKGFAKKLGAVRDIHGHVLGVAAIEYSIAIGQLLPIAQPHVDLSLHFQQCCQFVGGFNKRTGDIHPADPAVKALRQITRRPANAATDVKDVVTGSKRQSVSQFDGGEKSARVKMIDRRQLLHRHVVRRERRCLHRPQNARVDIAGGPMI